jgi:4-amino-4-deoxy-L-arabinose transferase-like glycosyltransferase
VPKSNSAALLESLRNDSGGDAGRCSQPGAGTDLSRSVFSLLLLSVVALAVALYVSLGWSWEKFSRAEVFFAECAREMLRDGNYVTPLYHGRAFFDKPILVYWLILGMFKTFGVSHLAARIPSILAAAATIAMTGIATARLFDRRSGILAAAAVASSFMFIGFSYLCMSDMTLVMFDVITMCLLYVGLLRESRRTLIWWLASVSMGLAFLTKGPIGIVLPALAFLLFLGLTRRLSLIKLHHVALGALTILAVSIPWWVAAYKANGSGALIYFFVRENLIRYAGSTYDTHKPIWFMVVSLMTGFAPWSIFLPIVLWGGVRKWRSGDRSPAVQHELYLWLWIIVVTGFFSFSRGKCDYYVLPTYPAAAALTGMYLTQWIRRRERPAVGGLRLLAIGYLVTAGGAALILQNMSHELTVGQWVLMPAVLGLSAVVIFTLLRRGKLYPAYLAAFAGLCLSAACFATQVVPAVVRLIPIGEIAAALNRLPGGERLGVHDALGSWVDEITFQTDREPVRLYSIPEMEQFLAAPGPALVVCPEDKLGSLPQQQQSKLHVLDRRVGITHTLTPGYAIKRKGHLTDPMPVVLVTNR